VVTVTWMVDCGGGKRVSICIWLRALFGYEFCLVTGSGKDRLDQSFVGL
jgi:hypothetical protein